MWSVTGIADERYPVTMPGGHLYLGYGVHEDGVSEEIAPAPFSDTSQLPHSMSSYLCVILFQGK